MNFTHDFTADLAACCFTSSEPWALARFADGERAVLEGRDIPTADGWTSPGSESQFAKALWESLKYNEDNYHVGISCPCCDEDAHRFYKAHAGVPDCRQTYSNLFCNANSEVAFRRLKAVLPDAVVIHPVENCVNDEMQNIERLLLWLSLQHIDERQPIFVAAGPASNIIIHRYWTETAPHKRRVIVDIGSALDTILRQQMTRGYHHPNHPNRSKVCRWS